MKHLLALLFFFFFLQTPVSAEEPQYWSKLANNISELIQQAEKQYSEGDAKEAKRMIVKAYFGIFEDKKMEAAMRMELGAQYTYRVEKKFGTMRKLISKKAPQEEVQQVAKEIQETMKQDALKLDLAGIPAEVFLVNQ